MTINLEGYDLIGTPEEILHLLDLLGEEVAAVEKPVIETPERPAPKPKAKPATAAKAKKIDWNKARALREAGWSYVKIGDELGISDVTVAAHLKKTHLM